MLCYLIPGAYWVAEFTQHLYFKLKWPGGRQDSIVNSHCLIDRLHGRAGQDHILLSKHCFSCLCCPTIASAHVNKLTHHHLIFVGCNDCSAPRNFCVWRCFCWTIDKNLDMCATADVAVQSLRNPPIGAKFSVTCSHACSPMAVQLDPMLPSDINPFRRSFGDGE